MLVVVGLGGRRLAANAALERTLVRVGPNVLLQVVRPMEGLVANLALVLLVHLVLSRVPQPVVLPSKLTTAVVARVRFDLLVHVNVRLKVVHPDEALLALVALVRHRRPVVVRPLVDLQVPLGGQLLVADRALVRGLALMRGHVQLKTRLDVPLLADGTLDRVLFDLRITIHVRQADVPGQTVLVDETLPAERTRLRLFVVCLLVPRELGLSVADLKMKRNEILYICHIS